MLKLAMPETHTIVSLIIRGVNGNVCLCVPTCHNEMCITH